MKNKIYRCFVDVEASNLDNARKGINALTEGNGSQFKVLEQPFTHEEEVTILETARVALSDADIYEAIADKLDLADDELKALQEKIEKVTNG